MRAYVLAVLATLLATVLRWLLDPFLGPYQTYLFFILASYAAAWWWGWKPAAVSMLLGLALGSYLFAAPYGLGRPEHRLAVGGYLMLSGVGILIAGARRRANEQAEEHQRTVSRAILALEQRRKELEAANTMLERRVRQRTGEFESAQRHALRMAAIVASSEDAIYSLDASARIATWNPGAERIFGYTPSEVVGKPTTLLVHPERAGEEAATIGRVLEGWPVRQLETVRLHKGGREVHVSLSATPLLDEMGAADGIAVIASDITERRALENQMRQAQKMEAIGQLAGGIAHDFNNLLTIITGYCDVLLAKSPPDGPDTESLREIDRAGRQAALLTRQLLVFSRKQTLDPLLLNLNSLSEELGKMLRRLIGEDITLEYGLDPHLSAVKVDPGQFSQVLVNLVVNARDAMPRGGYLTIATRNLSVSSKGASAPPKLSPGDYVVLSVTDTGHGMDEATRARVFEPFFTTKEPGKGTGLGLATVHGIVKQSGGAIAVVSQPGKGTTFEIFLPAAAADPVSEEAFDSEDHLLPTGTETILLVEDEAGVRNLSQMLLEELGYHVLNAADGRDALNRLENYDGHLDLVVTDVVMPRVDGPQLVQELRKRRPHLKVLYVSGYSGDALASHGLQPGEPAFLRKPFTGLGLARKVRETLDQPAPPDAGLPPDSPAAPLR